ncbi:MAG: ABC transporter permease [Rhodospirillales bacterium]|nr:ABC transporter permease [Rhodospirillales bacterium]
MPDQGTAAVLAGGPPSRFTRAYGGVIGWLRSRTLATRAALAILLVYVLLGLLGSLLVPYSPTAFDMMVPLNAPSWQHFFGTDGFGRDVFSRVVAGTSTILILSVSATVWAVGVGVSIGLASGYRGGRPDEFVMRGMDVLMALPTLLLALLILTWLGSSKPNLIFAIGVVFVPKSARVARSAVLSLRKLGYIEAAKLRGDHAGRILLFEVLPNVRDVVGVEFCVRFAYSLLLISSLGFLGLGVQPPEPDWGQMISEGRNYITLAWWIVMFPALAIGILVVAVNLLADGLWQDRTRLQSARIL